MFDRVSSIENCNDFGPDFLFFDGLFFDRHFFDDQASGGDRQLESSRAGAAGIEVEDAVLCLLLGHVAVTVDDHAETRGFRLEIELGEIVENVDRDAGKLDYFGLGQFLRPRGGVDIAADCGDGGDCG
jgi:hypothetical protein